LCPPTALSGLEFGGYKRSGLGRESGLLAIREFVQEKSVWIETTGADTPNPFVIPLGRGAAAKPRSSVS